MWFSRHGGVGVMVGLDDLGGLFQPSGFYDFPCSSPFFHQSSSCTSFSRLPRDSSRRHAGQKKQGKVRGCRSRGGCSPHVRGTRGSARTPSSAPGAAGLTWGPGKYHRPVTAAQSCSRRAAHPAAAADRPLGEIRALPRQGTLRKLQLPQ